jgi:multiple sugar transport system substrate-binding protein
MTFVKWLVDNGWKWSKAGHLPTSIKVLESEELKKQPFRENYSSEVEYMEFLPPTSKTWFANSSLLIETMDGVWIEKYTPDEGLKEIEKAIQTELQ